MTSTRARGRAATVAWLVGSLTLARTAWADEQSTGIVVDAARCAWIDAAEVDRLLRLELAPLTGVSGAAPSLGVRLECDASAILIRVADPTTDKVVERSIPAPDPTDPGAERIIALSTSQLVLASWLEVLLPKREKAALQPPAIDTPARVAARRAATRALPPASARAELEPAASGGVRVRDSSSPFPLWHAGVGVGAWLGTWWGLFAEAGIETGSAARERGEVAATLAGGSGGTWLRPVRAGPVALEARLSLGASYLRINGNPSRRGGTGASIEGAAGEFRGELGPAARLGPVRVAAVAEGGVLVGAPEAVVYREASMSLSGPWFGGALRVGLGL